MLRKSSLWRKPWPEGRRRLPGGRTAGLAPAAALLLAAMWVFPGAAWPQSLADGAQAYADKDYEKALAILKPLAAVGNRKAQKILGVMHEHGYGVEADATEAMKWYLLAAQQGDPEVQHQVGANYFHGRGVEADQQKAATWWERAADSGQADAQFDLALLYFRGGAKVPRDGAKAAELFQLAAEQGHGQAQYSLGVLHASGRDVEQDYLAAFLWFKKAADQGVSKAQFNLGVFYENGYGVKKDPATARQWYERAAAHGLPQAREKLRQAVPRDAVETAGANGNEWAKSQAPEHYTIQLISLSDEERLAAFLKQHKLWDKTVRIEIRLHGETRYNALHGVYDDYAKAQLAIAELPEVPPWVKPWVRNFGILQKLMR